MWNCGSGWTFEVTHVKEKRD